MRAVEWSMALRMCAIELPLKAPKSFNLAGCPACRSCSLRARTASKLFESRPPAQAQTTRARRPACARGHRLTRSTRKANSAKAHATRFPRVGKMYRRNCNSLPGSRVKQSRHKTARAMLHRRFELTQECARIVERKLGDQNFETTRANRVTMRNNARQRSRLNNSK